jgi:predicted metal-binding membrane protein
MLAWLILGIAAATLLSSAGPIFFERLFGGGQFSALGETLDRRGAWMTLVGSDAMWIALTSDKAGAIAGISAMPSLHVAISVWIYLAARTMAPRAAPYALGYTIFIFLASVQLGWHYVSDGLAGAAGMLLVWALAGLVARPDSSSPLSEPVEQS